MVYRDQGTLQGVILNHSDVSEGHKNDLLSQKLSLTRWIKAHVMDSLKDSFQHFIPEKASHVLLISVRHLVHGLLQYFLSAEYCIYIFFLLCITPVLCMKQNWDFQNHKLDILSG